MKTMKFLAVITIVIASLTTMSSCTTRMGAIQQMQNLAYDMRDTGQYYTVKDWKAAAEKFADLRRKMAKYDYTPAERRQIGEIEGQCARYMVQGVKDGAINGIMSVGNEIKGILDGLGIKY